MHPSRQTCWLLLLPESTAPTDVWHVIYLNHMVASADAVLYIPDLQCAKRVLNTTRDAAYVFMDVFLMDACFSKFWGKNESRGSNAAADFVERVVSC